YVDALALEMGGPRDGDKLVFSNTAVFTIPDDLMPGDLDAILGSGPFGASSEGAGPPMLEWYVDTRDADNSSIIVVFPAPATVPGDATLDGQVNITDLGALAVNWKAVDARWCDGDFTGDGIVNITDLGALAANWHVGVGAISVPEPASAALWYVCAGVPPSVILPGSCPSECP
ncbi:hypothetical protein LCGC14_2607400, partial [marine sediment metagenome]